MLLTTWVESVPELIIIEPLKTSPYKIGNWNTTRTDVLNTIKII